MCATSFRECGYRPNYSWLVSLKQQLRKDFGDNLFRDWRYDKQNNPIKSFILNDPAYSGEVLVAGKNFGFRQ